MSGKECVKECVKETELSVLFADVAGSARLYEKLGAAEALRAVDRCLKRMERAVESFRGRIVKSGGDEMMAVFERADDALQAASEMQQRISDLPPVSGVKLAMRAGFHHGALSEVDGNPSGSSVEMAARLTGLAKAGQVLLDARTQALLSPFLQLSTRGLETPSAKEKADTLHIVEVIWHEADTLSLQAGNARPATPTSGDGARLCVRYAGKVIILDEKNTSIALGRDAGGDVVVRDRRASRKHARIERQGESFVLVDQSTNGTFVTLADQPELFLRRSEVVLHGSGMICFAASASSQEADCAEFEHL